MEGPIAGMKLGQLEAEGEVLHAGEETVGDVLPPRHALLDHRPSALEPRAEHEVRVRAQDRLDDLRDQRGVVLVIRVDHHHDIAARPERLGVAGLLVGAVAVVPVVDEDLQAQLARDLERGVRGSVVHEDHEVHRVLGQFLIRHAEGPPRIVGGHDHDDLGGGRHGLS